mmetsp:Transcript_38062/g.69581  ORF Transcript_38062/g.69581 Transcript_38062/m.69581 type:complete len:182 (+) Transcript_38062:69-614(+)
MRSLLTAVLVLPACAFVVPKFYSQQLRSTLITTQAVDAELVPTAPELVPTAPTKVEPAPDASAEEKADFIASLAEDDEWNGLTMELTGLIGKAVEEDMKRVTRGFIGKEEYKMGDISKEVDKRIKAEVALMRDKPDYELGDLSLVLDEVAKDMVCELTGKEKGEYEFGLPPLPPSHLHTHL